MEGNIAKPTAEDTQSQKEEEGISPERSPELSPSALPEEVSNLPPLHFHQDMDRWKNLYEACQGKLQQLKMLQAQIEEAGAASAEVCEARQSWEELRAELEVATLTLSQERSYVEEALEKHGAVLLQLIKRLQDRHAGTSTSNRLRRQGSPEHNQLEAKSSDSVLEDTASRASSQLQRQPKASLASSASAASSNPLGTATAITKETIDVIKELIREHEKLSASVEKERNKQRKYPDLKECLDAQTLRAKEDKLRRTSSLLQLQVKRLQYELSRLNQAQSCETDAVTKLLEQATAELQISLTPPKDLNEMNCFVVAPSSGCQELYRHASRNSFVESLEDMQRHRDRLARLESRLHSERVYHEVEQLDEQVEILHCLGEEITEEIRDMSETKRAFEGEWFALRQERDELTAHLHPDLQRLQELQEIAKENIELETKLHKENFLFRKQLEDFQKDLLEVETDLLTGNIHRRARATKNIVAQLQVLRDCIMQQNDELWRELREKNLSVSPSDSLASAVMAEEDFRQHITNKMKKMELRIKEDLDRRALFKPKVFVFEPPGTVKIPFRGQRNVIRVPSKAAADWRKMTTIELHRQEAMERQVENLRRDILSKLHMEKEKAKQRLLDYEARRHVADSETASAQGVGTDADAKATLELRAILTQLNSFLRRSRGGSSGREGEVSSSIVGDTADESDQQDDYGRDMRSLVLQLEKLQNALEGSTARERDRRGPTLESVRELFNRLTDAEGTGFRNRRESTESSRELQGQGASRSPRDV